MLILPYKVDVPMARWPATNVGIIVLTVYAFIAASVGAMSPRVEAALVLDGYEPAGLIGCVLAHADVLHLVGNMLFLWIFGNAVCAKVGNWVYVALYLVLAMAASLTHVLLDGAPAIGASGAVNGVVGMFLVFYPRNQVSCVWMWWIGGYTGREGGEFEVDSRVMIGFWFVLDLVGAMFGGGGVAYWAHLGGFTFGFLIATALLYFRIVVMSPAEQSIFVFAADWLPASIRNIGKPADDLDTIERDFVSDAAADLSSVEHRPADRPIRRRWAASLLKLRCGCGNVMRVARRHVGKQGRCPACKAEFTIPKPRSSRLKADPAHSVEL